MVEISYRGTSWITLPWYYRSWLCWNGIKIKYCKERGWGKGLTANLSIEMCSFKNLTGFFHPKRIKQKEMNGFWLKQEPCFLIRNWTMPGGIFKSLSRFPKETYKTLAGKSPWESNWKGAFWPGGRGWPKDLLSCFLVLIWWSNISRRRKWEWGRCPHSWSLKVVVLTGKWKCYDSEIFVFNLWSFTDHNPAGLFKNQSVKTGGPCTGYIIIWAFSQVMSHLKIRGLH